jgi:HlyD family secretion protein
MKLNLQFASTAQVCSPLISTRLQPGEPEGGERKRFQPFAGALVRRPNKAVKTALPSRFPTPGLKPGANEMRYRIKLPCAVLCAVIGIVIAGCKPPGAGVVRYETAPVARGNIVQHVTASGTLSAVVSVDVGSQVSGKISVLNADYNSPVKKGQLVAEIDPTIYQASLRQTEGELASAKANVTLKRQNLERKKTLVPMHAASQLDLDQAVAELAQAEATVTIKQASLESAQANLGYCKITAPVDGIVIARKVDLGQTVNAAMSTPVLFTVAQDITKMNINASVSEADIGQVKEGQPVDFTVDAFPDEVFLGKVTQVRKSPTTTQNVVTYETIITVDNPEQKLFPGMTADVSILVAERKGVLKIPNTALRFTPSEGASYEQKPPAKLERNQRLAYAPGSDPAKLKPVILKAGITDGVDTEILDGLAEGGSVVTSALATGAKSGGFGGPPPQGPQ